MRFRLATSFDQTWGGTALVYGGREDNHINTMTLLRPTSGMALFNCLDRQNGWRLHQSYYRTQMRLFEDSPQHGHRNVIYLLVHLMGGANGALLQRSALIHRD